MHPPPHQVAFTGAVHTAAYCPADGDLVLADPTGRAAAGPRLAGTAGPRLAGTALVASHYPPRTAAAREVAEAVELNRPRRLVAIGDGYTLDVAKQAWSLAPHPALCLVPAGAEAWRAFAPFTSLYEADGQRVSRADTRFATAQVIIDVSLLAARDSRTRALQRADTAVHAVEVLLSRRAQEWAGAHARAALSALLRDQPADDVVAAGLATEAFAAGGLGLAHAAASPLGARAGRTHDTVNVLLAPYVIDHWAGQADLGWAAIGQGLGCAGAPAAVSAVLRAMREAAGVPDTLAEAGFSWDQVAEVVPIALRSSGIPWLPSTVDERALTGLLHRAWSG